jgi:hypothetical protein
MCQNKALGSYFTLPLNSLRSKLRLWLCFIMHRLSILNVPNDNRQDFLLIYILIWVHRGRDSWIYDYLCNQFPSPLKLCVRITLITTCTIYNIICQWFATGMWFSPSTPVSSTNKTDLHDIAEIFLKVALNTITLTLTLHSNFNLILWD